MDRNPETNRCKVRRQLPQVTPGCGRQCYQFAHWVDYKTQMLKLIRTHLDTACQICSQPINIHTLMQGGVMASVQLIIREEDKSRYIHQVRKRV